MSPSVKSHVDLAQRTAVITTEFDHAVDVVWTLWSDPDNFARWWGPPGMPMTVHRHELRPGGTIEFSVASPHGMIRGKWTIHAMDPPRSVTFRFTSDGLEPTDVSIRLVDTSSTSTALHMTLQFSSDEIMRHALDIGFVDGVTRSVAAAHPIAAADPS